jgi:hypothetical protein
LSSPSSLVYIGRPDDGGKDNRDRDKIKPGFAGKAHATGTSREGTYYVDEFSRTTGVRERFPEPATLALLAMGGVVAASDAMSDRRHGGSGRSGWDAVRHATDRS